MTVAWDIGRWRCGLRQAAGVRVCGARGQTRDLSGHAGQQPLPASDRYTQLIDPLPTPTPDDTVAMNRGLRPAAMPRTLLPQLARHTVAWPRPALLAWIGAGAVHRAGSAAGLDVPLALGGGVTVAALVAFLPAIGAPWRRVLVAAGYPAAVLASSAGLPPWAWLAAVAALALAYPLKAWRDAPWFPTPHRALHGLAKLAPLPPDARILDAGCGLGDGLIALRREWPQARFDGIEWSWPLRLAAGARCRFARVRRGDLWEADWAPYALVYLFQRPESMARAAAKAEAEMRPGSWLASLAFEVPGRAPDAVLRRPASPPVLLYRVGSIRCVRRR